MNSSDWDRIASDYHNEVVSPFQDGVVNPLFSKIENMDGVVADIGCGRGEILGTLSEKFGKVYAIDFSEKMLDAARRRKLRNVDFVKRDMKNLGFQEEFDVAIAANSILFPETENIKKSLVSIRASLKNDGTFLGIFPSMESILYQGFLIFDREVKKNDDEKALKDTKKILERDKYNFVRGTFTEGGCTQKFYYRFELRHRLKEAGFRKIRVTKVLYPWSDNVSGYEVFKGRPRMWDWFVTAKK